MEILVRHGTQSGQLQLSVPQSATMRQLKEPDKSCAFRFFLFLFFFSVFFFGGGRQAVFWMALKKRRGGPSQASSIASMGIIG